MIRHPRLRLVGWFFFAIAVVGVAFGWIGAERFRHSFARELALLEWEQLKSRRLNLKRRPVFLETVNQLLRTLEAKIDSPTLQAKALSLFARTTMGERSQSPLLLYLLTPENKLLPWEGEPLPQKRLIQDFLAFLRSAHLLSSDKRKEIVKSFAESGLYQFLFGEDMAYRKIYDSPHTPHLINFRKKGSHLFFWSRLIDPRQHSDAPRNDFSIPDHGIVLVIVEWRAFDRSTVEKMAVDNWNADFPSPEFGIVDFHGTHIASATPPAFFSQPLEFTFEGENSIAIAHKEMWLGIPLDSRGFNVRAGGRHLMRKLSQVDLFNQRFSNLRLGLWFLTFIPLALSLLFFRLSKAEFIGLKFKYFLSLALFIIIPILLFFIFRIYDLGALHLSACREAQDKTEIGLKKLFLDLELEFGAILEKCRAIKRNHDFAVLSPEEKLALAEEYTEKDNFDYVLVYDARGNILFDSLAGSKKKGERSELYSSLVQAILAKFAPQTEEVKGSGNIVKEALVDSFLGDMASTIVKQEDELAEVNLFGAQRLIYFDMVFDAENSIKYILFVSLNQINLIKDFLEERCETLNLSNDPTKFYLFSHKRMKLRPDGGPVKRRESWHEEFKSQVEERRSGRMAIDFDQEYLVTTHYSDKFQNLGVGFFPRMEVDSAVRRKVVGESLFLAFILVFMLLVVFGVTHGFLRSLNTLREAMVAVKTRQYDYALALPEGDEIGQIGTLFNEMLAGLQEKEKLAISRAELKYAFSRFLSPAVVEQMEKDPSLLQLGGRAGEITAFFSDLEGFSSLSEQLPPEKLVEFLNEYLTAMTEILLDANGTLDKFIGDAIVAFFGAPVSDPLHPYAAIACGLTMQKRLALLREKWSAERDRWPAMASDLRMRIGINGGLIVTGNMGSQNRMNYTMMGDAVNLASRLESLGKQYGLYILVSRESLWPCRDNFLFREIDRVRVAGRKTPVEIFEVLDFSPGEESYHHLLAPYNEGLRCFRERRFGESLAFFQQALALETNPKLSPSAIYLQRCRDIMRDKNLEPSEQIYDAHGK